jgi:hypothetical protein
MTSLVRLFVLRRMTLAIESADFVHVMSPPVLANRRS